MKETREIILGLKKAGKTIFFNSHILSEVEKICDKVGVLHKGAMSEIKTVADIVKEHGDVEKYFVKIAGEN